MRCSVAVPRVVYLGAYLSYLHPVLYIKDITWSDLESVEYNFSLREMKGGLSESHERQ